MLFLLLPLSQYYLHYFYLKLLCLLSLSKYIIAIIWYRVYYGNYGYYINIILIMSFSDYYNNYGFQSISYALFCFYKIISIIAITAMK